MDRLNDILWLKCFLALRVHQGSTSSALGTVLLLLFSFCSMLPAAAILAVFLVALVPGPSTELVHLTLALLYFMWISFPVVGYKISEFLDVTRLLHYPVTPTTLFLGMLLASFLDPAAFLIYPFLGAVAIGTAPSPAALLPVLAVLLLFVVHTFAVGQTVLFLMVNLLNLRRFAELLLIGFPIVLFLSVCGLELSYVLALPVERGSSLEPSTILAFFPPGVASSALIAIRDQCWPDAAYHLGVLAALTLLTLVVSSRLVDRVLRGSPRLEAAAARLSRLVAGVCDLFGRLLPSGVRSRRTSPAAGRSVLEGAVAHVSAVAIKSFKLTLREPQFRIALGFFVASIGLLVLVGVAGREGGDVALAIPMLSVLSVIILSSVYLNNLALERDGLKFVMASPVATPSLLIGTNLAHWAIATATNAVTMGLLAVTYRVSLDLLVVYLHLGQVVLVLMLGVGNLVSVLLPYRFPSKGVHPRHETTAGQQFLVNIVGGFSSIATTLVAAALVGLWLVAASSGRPILTGVASAVLAWTVVAFYAVATAIASWCLERRREVLMRQIAE